MVARLSPGLGPSVTEPGYGWLNQGDHMTRSFFDVKCDASIEHDYKGRHLPSFDEAQQMAELIAMDLGFTRADGPFGMEVQIRNAAGALLALVPVKLVEALVA